MPSPEHGGRDPHDPDTTPSPNPAPEPYLRAARFAGERPAGEAYFAVQRVIYEAPQPLDLSVFRLQLDRLWHVAALGILPPAPVLYTIEKILDMGEATTLPEEVVTLLQERRARSITQAPWAEGHYRPGKRL